MSADPRPESVRPSIRLRAIKYGGIIVLLIAGLNLKSSLDVYQELSTALGSALLSFLSGWFAASLTVAAVIWVHRREGTPRTILFFVLMFTLVSIVGAAAFGIWFMYSILRMET